MTAQLIDGKAFATQLRKEIRQQILTDPRLQQKPPGLAVVLVGDDPASAIYVRNKRLACEEVGIQSFYHSFPSTLPEADLIALITQLNNDTNVDGILVQAPLPAHINADKIFELIDPRKDVDGFHPYNLGRLAQRRPLLRPCTPYGIILLLNSIQQIYKGKHAVVVGASNIVGRPMALELLIAGATVTICHRFTTNLDKYVSDADILVAAVGKPNLIHGDWIKAHSTVIDVGLNRLDDGRIIGDIDFEEAKKKAAWITPVPGGVGPMTVAILLQNTLTAALNLQSL